jgi:glycosyltransferase involved in cell wall biosynthesis
MKILFVNASLEAVRGGGTAERTFCLARHLALLGEQVSVLTTDIGGGHRRLEGIPGLAPVVLHSLLDRFYLPAPALHTVYRAVSSADAVHIMNHWTAINAMAYWAARLAGRPYVVSPAGALPTFGRSRHIKAAYNALVGRAIVRNAARGIAITEDEISQFTTYGLPANRVMVIPNGVDIDDAAHDLTDTCPLPALGGRPFVLFIGRLNTIKGPDLLLEAFLSAAREFPEMQLVFAGPDEGLGSALKATATAAGMTGRVHFAGPVLGGAKRWLLRHATLVAIPSRQEAMSIVVLEAGAHGRPVLLTDQCGFPQLADCGGGLIVPANAGALERGLRELLQPGAPLADMGARLQRLVRERYTWNAAACALQASLRNVVAEARTT